MVDYNKAIFLSHDNSGVDLHHLLLSELLKFLQHVRAVAVGVVAAHVGSVAVVGHQPQMVKGVAVLRAARRSVPQPPLQLSRRHRQSAVQGRSHEDQAVRSPPTPLPRPQTFPNNLFLPFLLIHLLFYFFFSSVLLLVLAPSQLPVHPLEDPGGGPSVGMLVRRGHGEGGGQARLGLPLLLCAAL